MPRVNSPLFVDDKQKLKSFHSSADGLCNVSGLSKNKMSFIDRFNVSQLLNSNKLQAITDGNRRVLMKRPSLKTCHNKIRGWTSMN
ncbi:hypothetical protein Zmor_000037 [Zophobas morio]|uniref:Uncharacterized protein n=1 Tax=Zophobas morio TaxID=2755281 RepID=A0AA38J0R5_9CUCU|nr:hypothetical protein Zmor_000037 [Zophobas morio]